jgi:hypothetical protein
MTGSQPPLPDRPLISGDDQQSGLWLLHGQTPALGETPTTPPPPPAGVKRIAHFLGAAAHRAKRLEPSERLVLRLAVIGLATWATVVSLSRGEPAPKNTPAIVSPPSLVIARPASATPPAAATAQLDQVPTPPPSIDQPGIEPTEPKTIRPRAWHRSRLVKRAHASFVYQWTGEPCRYSCDNWAEPGSWRGGGGGG